jgi:ATP-dependent helicase HrpA
MPRQQLQRLVPKALPAHTPWPQLQHLPRYLKAITAAAGQAARRPRARRHAAGRAAPLEQRFWRLLAERKGVADARLQEFRWLLEELRVSFFAQELRTPQPVSVKRLDKAWQQLGH